MTYAIRPAIEHLSERRQHQASKAGMIHRRSMAKNLEVNGYLDLSIGDGRENVWTDAEVLSDDMRNHFGDYYGIRETFINNVLAHDLEYRKLNQTLTDRLRLPPATEPQRSTLIPSLANKCVGIGTGMTMQVSRDHLSYGWAHGGGSGTASPEAIANMRETIDIFNRFDFGAPLTATCRALHDEVPSLARRARDAAHMAVNAAEATLLPGSCASVDPSLIR